MLDTIASAQEIMALIEFQSALFSSRVGSTALLPGGITGYYKDASKKLLGGFSPLEYPPSRQDSSAVGLGLLRHKEAGSGRRKQVADFSREPSVLCIGFLNKVGLVQCESITNVQSRSCSCCLLLHRNFFPSVPTEAPELKALLPPRACSDGWT